MKNTVCNVLLSIIDTQDPKFVKTKLDAIESLLVFNDVEKQIIKDVHEGLALDKVVSPAFISEKYAYYVDADDNIIASYLSRDALDSAIIDIHIKQLKNNLAKDILTLGSEIDTLTPDQIKEKFNFIFSNALINQKQKAAKNAIDFQEDAYGNLMTSKDGLSLILPKVEELAGKATKGSIVSILAFTGEYKSTYSINIAYENALKGHNVLYLSLEDSTIKVTSRFVVNHIAKTEKTRDTLLNGKWVRDNKLTPEQRVFYNKKHNEMVETLEKHLILWGEEDFEHDTFTGMTEALRLANKKFIEETGKPIDAVVLDQLALLKYTRGGGKSYSYDGAVLNDWVSFFRQQSLNFLGEGNEIVVFLVSQTSRNAHAEASKIKNLGRYTSSCTSDSHELERASSTMITLFKDFNNENRVLINIPKARYGEVPMHPLEEEVYGQYYHIGPLKFSNHKISAEDFKDQKFDFEDLLS